MHRFGRSAQQKIKDRWGGSFILATILALVGAWFAGLWLNDTLKGNEATNSVNPPGFAQNNGGSDTLGQQSTAVPKEFQLYLLQVGAFRSEASAQNLVHGLAEKGFTAMVAPRNTSGLYKVYAGLYTNQADANEAKERLAASGSFKDIYVAGVTVPHNPEAIPVALVGDKGPDLRKGMDAMNTFLYEAAVWIEKQAAGTPGNAAVLTGHEKELNQLAAAVNQVASSNKNLKPFADLAAAASANVTALQSVSAVGPSSAEYRAALRDYLAVLDQYRTLQAGATAKQ